MMMETKRQIAELLEINRSLARELDKAQRALSRAGRERDALAAEVGQLRDERDNLRFQLDESLIAIEEIQTRLEAQVEEPANGHPVDISN